MQYETLFKEFESKPESGYTDYNEEERKGNSKFWLVTSTTTMEKNEST